MRPPKLPNENKSNVLQYEPHIPVKSKKNLIYAVFTLGIFTAVKEFSYLGKFLVNVNIN